jgi:hypothetical protein
MKTFEVVAKYKSVGWLAGLVLLGVVAAVSFYFTDKTRKTFVFYDMKSEQARAEERMLMRSQPQLLSAEVGQYAEEAVFGPRNPASAPLFPKGTKLVSFLYRDAVVYIDLSEDAALPVVLPKQQADLGSGAGESTIPRNVATLKDGIKRNFPFVKETRVFIAGHETEF